MISVGITGNVASGKTTVADRWREAGARVIDADRIGHEVVAGDPAVREALVREFGGAILDYDGEIDREALGRRAFSTPEGVARLNAIVHPPLLERLDAALAEAARLGEDVVAVDAALVFEFHLDEVLDRIVLVTAPRDVRAERLMRERGMGEDRIEGIMAAQQPDAEKAPDSDYVIVNDGSLDDLRRRADAVLAAIRREADDTSEEVADER